MKQKIRFFSDPHLGVRRKAHTTKKSAAALQNKVFDYALEACRYTAPDSNLRSVVMLGDLFDASQNPESVLVQGWAVAQECNFVLSGNHDLVNREGVVSTFDALADMDASERFIRAEDYDNPTIKNLGSLDVSVTAIPHHASQAVFDEALQIALELAKSEKLEGHRTILLLHCNYNLEFAVDNDATLNLTTEQATELLTGFDYILSGHEHNSSEHLDGRLIMLGNTYPTSFSDISDKYVWDYDLVAGVMEKHCIWSKASGYIEIPYTDGLKPESVAGVESAQFIDVVGTGTAARASDISAFMNSLRESAPNAIAIRNNVAILDGLKSVEVAEKPSLINLRDEISEDLKDSDVYPLWKELSAKAEDH